MSERTPRKTESNTVSRLFDLRMIIAILFWIYGVVLTIMGISPSDADLERAGGLNLNLWSGIGMMLLAAFFTTWVLMRPLQMPSEDEMEAADTDGRPSH